MSRTEDVERLRPAREEDVEEIVSLVQRAYRGEGGWTTEAHLVDGSRTDAAEVRAMLADEAVSLLVAEVDGVLRGCVYTRTDPVQEGAPRQAELGLFAVDPAAQGRGLGGRLLRTQASQLAAAGVDLLVIRVLQSRPELCRWYERHGFMRTGEVVPFAGDPELLRVPGLGMELMRLPLTASAA